MKRSWATPCGIILLAIKGLAQSPVLSYATPAAVKPGATTTVTFFGENLSGAAQLWTSFSAQAVVAAGASPPENGSGRAIFRVTVPAETPPGVGAVRVATTNGLSSLLLLLVDHLSGVAECGTNKSAESAQGIQPPVAVDGTVDELGFDYYKFTARKGERCSVEVVAQRFGSRLDPVLRLLATKGRELARSDDEPGLGADSRIAWQCPATGEYLLELRDMLYQGGAQYRYRLRVNAAPLPSVRVGPGKKGLPELAEVEPNDTAQTATRFTVPALLSGSFARDRDRDFYQFDAAKNQRLVFRAQTRSLGSPGEVFMQLQRADGSRVAEGRVNGADEGVLTNKFAEAGPHRLLVEELNRRGGPDFAYRVQVERLHPGFALNVETDKVEASAGGSFEIKVICSRREFDGPIQLSLDGASEGFTLDKAVIPEQQTNTVFKVKVPPHLAPGDIAHFQIIGRAQMGETEQSATASTRPALRKLFPQTPYPPVELEGWIGLGIRTPTPPAAP